MPAGLMRHRICCGDEVRYWHKADIPIALTNVRFCKADNWRSGMVGRRNHNMMEGKDLGAVFDAHIKAEFVDRDVAETMATMTPEPHLTHVPTLTGGTGRSEVERFYREHFVGHWPDDVQVKSVSRTVGQNQVVDELIVSFTHDREMRVYLPGVVPTGRKVVLPHVVVMGFDEGGRVAHEHIYWDQASLLVQVGLLDPALLPVSGADQAKRLLDPEQPANEMIERRRLKPK
jgi:carboxymethylenebutenolidase